MVTWISGAVELILLPHHVQHRIHSVIAEPGAEELRYYNSAKAGRRKTETTMKQPKGHTANNRAIELDKSSQPPPPPPQQQQQQKKKRKRPQQQQRKRPSTLRRCFNPIVPPLRREVCSCA